MNLPKAIEIIELNIKSVGKNMPTDTLAALKLENEAAKAILRIRNHQPEPGVFGLPGEDTPRKPR